MITDEQRKYITLFRLEGITPEWCVYWVFWRRYDIERFLQECRSDPRSWDYFRRGECNLLDAEMEAALQELQR